MRIVTADEIVAAFEKTAIKPRQCEFGDGTCGCAATAIYIAQGNTVIDGLDVSEWADEEFGVTGAAALFYGFDGHGERSARHTDHPNYLAGREAAKRLGLPVEE